MKYGKEGSRRPRSKVAAAYIKSANDVFLKYAVSGFPVALVVRTPCHAGGTGIRFSPHGEEIPGGVMAPTINIT